MLLLQGAKLLVVLESIYYNKNRIQRVNFINQGLFTITSSYNIKGLKNIITQCQELATKTPVLVKSHLQTTIEYLLGYTTITQGESR